jgi:hypothetical protein
MILVWKTYGIDFSFANVLTEHHGRILQSCGSGSIPRVLMTKKFRKIYSLKYFF